MIDINFYQKIHKLESELRKGKKIDKTILSKILEDARSKEPTIYNIETTNACNMKCEMCPRTTMMTRPIETMNMENFNKIVNQIKPWTNREWNKWQLFVEKEYGIKKNDMGENHFFLYIIPKVIQLHGYGAPLLDKHMPQRLKSLAEKGLESYFSCNPANINLERTIKMFENGLNHIKYSIESVDDEEHKKIRGKASNFTKSYEKICKLLEIKKEKNYKTNIIITMLDLNRDKQEKDFKKLRDAFKDKDVYIYLKSEDQQWYRKDYHGTNSIHWSEICRHPWMSMTIKSNSEVAMCMEDYNNEIILGDASIDSLNDIWNGVKYTQFRKDHLDLKSGIKCTEQCEMKLVGEMNLTGKLK